MGEIAEMMLDGTLCEGCGDYLGSDAGFPQYCGACARTMKMEQPRSRHHNPDKKFACQTCGKKFRSTFAAEQHARDAHKTANAAQ